MPHSPCQCLALLPLVACCLASLVSSSSRVHTLQLGKSELLCEGTCTADDNERQRQHPDSDAQAPPALKLAARAFRPFATGQIAPQGWLLDQLLLQANSLSGYMSQSTFPGAINVCCAARDCAWSLCHVLCGAANCAWREAATCTLPLAD